ncbi:MAG: hypothetical protein H0X19_14670 [Rubrobacter sp.]|jgi:hypothetical protein|nr:hypothetical protein [Rubrobacter sp.]
MERPKRETRLTPEEQALEERLMRSGDPVPQEGLVGVSEEFRRLSRTREGRRTLIKQIAGSGSPEDIKPGRPVSEDVWKLPKVKDPEGLLLKALLEDREQGR